MLSECRNRTGPIETEQRETEQPRALIVTIYGLYARDDGWLPVAALVRLLADLDVDEPAVRSAISRLKRRGLLEAVRRSGVAGYALSADAQEILAEGDARIFAPPTPRLADGWLLAVFSVPETERAKRHTLRSQLGALGFGGAAPGVWVAPAHRFELTVATLQRHAPRRLRRPVPRRISRVRRHREACPRLVGPRRTTCRLRELPRRRTARCWSGDPPTPFADWVRALTAWRRLPYRDPGLPIELLPPDWPGYAARDLLAELRLRLEAPARESALTTLTTAPRREG